MKSPNGQKYCVGCEMWQFDKDMSLGRKQRFGDLVPLQGKQDLVCKENKLQNKNMKNVNFNMNYSLNQTIIQCLQTKLYFLATLLNNESNVIKIREILDTIKVCMEDIKMAKTIL